MINVHLSMVLHDLTPAWRTVMLLASDSRLVFILRGLTAEAIQNSLLRFKSLSMSATTNGKVALGQPGMVR